MTMVHAPIWKTELGQIAERHPDLKLIIDHMGIMARCVDDAIGYWVQETADLCKHPNIHVKVSAIPRLLHPAVPEPQHRQVRARGRGQDGPGARLLGAPTSPA